MAAFSLRSVFLILLTFLSNVQLSVEGDTITINPKSGEWISYENSQGQSVWLNNFRKPALYTGDFGDCEGDSLVNLTRFDAALYTDNMTVLVHWAGETALLNQSLMVYLAVYAYGKTYWELPFNPCNANINSLCPMNASVPIEASFNIPIGQNTLDTIPSIAYSIPDFEGQAIMRIFANISITDGYQIGCFSARLTNGATFSQPQSVGPILGIFAFVALVASFATTVYGDEIPTMRTHYAHSLSVLVVFAVYQHIFFTGALSVNWPSVLPAFWSNYAWSAGMIYVTSMQDSISNFIGNNVGNTSMVGAAGTGTTVDVGGGYDISQIYRKRKSKPAMAGTHLAKRTLLNSTDGFKWYGNPVTRGLPLPGNFSGFAGTLGDEKIPASNAFLTGLIWFLILLLCVCVSVVAFKFLLEALARLKAMKSERFNYFRRHWLLYTAQAALRTCFIAFFMMTFLTLFQSTYRGASAVIAIAAIVFVIFVVGMFGIAGYACYYRLRYGKWVNEPDRLLLERKNLLHVFPYFGVSRRSKHPEETETHYLGSIPAWRFGHVPPEGDKHVHEDEGYIRKFGWLASRFRRTRWWFFAAWLVYELVRACFFAGASGHAMTQVFGLLAVEIIAFIAIIYLRPFEGQRLNALVVYCLGFSKVATVALSAAFDVSFNLQRITTTAIGIVIIVIQGILTIVLFIAIVVGAISSWFSVTRNRKDEEFRPRKWLKFRTRYFQHLEYASTGVAPPPKPKKEKKLAKDVQESNDEVPSSAEKTEDAIASNKAAVGSRRSRALSMTSNLSRSSLPYGARQHRSTWSRDF
ncbi:TRP-domain-containing protein, partial [Rhizodiscina lignyota]